MGISSSEGQRSGPGIPRTLFFTSPFPNRLRQRGAGGESISAHPTSTEAKAAGGDNRRVVLTSQARCARAGKEAERLRGRTEDLSPRLKPPPAAPGRRRDGAAGGAGANGGTGGGHGPPASPPAPRPRRRPAAPSARPGAAAPPTPFPVNRLRLRHRLPLPPERGRDPLKAAGPGRRSVCLSAPWRRGLRR